MVKNALEACKEDERVTLSSQLSKGGVSFSVHNPGQMPREVQLQLFKRSFTTKGTGRGLGTYSMKLLTERYLKGKISFASSETDGTTFSVTLECRANGKTEQ
jgi:signal transduction histidine kinase